MGVHSCKNKSNAKKMVNRYRRKGYNATAYKSKKGWRVSVSRAGKNK